MINIDRLKSSLEEAQARVLELEKSAVDNMMFLNIFNSSPVAFGLSDPAGNIINLNTAFIKLFGYEIEDIPIVADWRLKAYPEPKYREWVIKTWQKHLDKAQQTQTDFVPMEVKIQCKNKTQCSALLTGTSLTKSHTGSHLVIFYDITEIKQAKNKIANLSDSLANITASLEHQNKSLEIEKKKALISEERLRLAMKGANDGLWDCDLAGGQIYFSPRWKSMLGYAENEIEGSIEAWRRLVHPDDRVISMFNFQAFMEKKTDQYEIEFRMLHKNGHYLDILSRAFSVENQEGKITRLVGTHLDITERKKVDQQLSYQSSHDSLTGLVNRREFERRAERLLATAITQSQQHALCYIDLDQFRVVNDACGHSAGDEMLRQLGFLLQKAVRSRDTLARLGGDEFAVLIEHCSLDNAHRVTETIQAVIQDYQFIWQGCSFPVGASIGLVSITNKTLNFTELLKAADAACYMAKEKGRNRIHIHRDEDKEQAERQGELQWVTRIQHALDEDRFCLYAQAIESLDTRVGSHYELLVRMVSERGEIIPPGAFLPAAERYNLIGQLDRWVVSNAFSLLMKNTVFLEQINFISINLSGQSLTDESFLDFVIKELKGLEGHSSKICFEITETAAISNLGLADKIISQLRQFGCCFALDDFGSGLSSFGYLKNLTVDYLKIDGMFVKDIVDDPIDHAMVKSINDIGQIMGMKTIAEFVENDDIKDMLTEIGVNYAQGYAVHKPQPFVEILGKSNNVIHIKQKIS